jgi:hypothetical protein
MIEFSALGFVVAAAGAAPAYPLLDGSCAEYEALGATRVRVDQDVMLLSFQDADYVWFCFKLPSGSYGTLDLQIRAAGMEAALNLHVSAQLGEWRADRSDEAPKDANSDKWWKVSGWWANTLRFNGVEKGGPRFLTGQDRELQISKAKFGRGDWDVRAEINDIAAGDDSFRTVRLPARPHDTFTLKVK